MNETFSSLNNRADQASTLRHKQRKLINPRRIQKQVEVVEQKFQDAEDDEGEKT